MAVAYEMTLCRGVQACPGATWAPLSLVQWCISCYLSVFVPVLSLGPDELGFWCIWNEACGLSLFGLLGCELAEGEYTWDL